jgi:chromosome segregation ATPase
MKSHRNAGRGNKTPRREKTKAKRQKHRFSDRYLPEKNHVPTREEVVKKTLGRLRSLGNQIFALSPFNKYFDDWLINLRDVLSDFESSPTISADNQFVKEYSQILSNLERELEERRHKETAHEGDLKSISDNTSLLNQIDEEYATKTMEIKERKNSEIKRLSRNVQDLEEELNRIAKMKTGIFRSLSKKTKGQKEAEATQKLNTAQSELKLAQQNFTTEQEKLRNEYEKRKQPIIEQIQNLQKEIENLEIDGSLETRRTACEALANAVNALLQRNR